MTTGSGGASFGFELGGENEEGRTLLVINSGGSERPLRETAYYTGQSMAVHVEPDSELGKEPPVLRTLAIDLNQPPAEPEGSGTYDPDVNVADPPSAVGKSRKLQIFLDSPDLYDQMLDRAWDGPYAWGRSDAIHVWARNKEPKLDPLPPELQDTENEGYPFDDFESTGGAGGNLIDHFDQEVYPGSEVIAKGFAGPSTTWSVTTPTVEVGDLLLIWFYSLDTGGGISVTPPAGISYEHGTSADQYTSAWSRQIDGTESWGATLDFAITQSGSPYSLTGEWITMVVKGGSGTVDDSSPAQDTFLWFPHFNWGLSEGGNNKTYYVLASWAGPSTFTGDVVDYTTLVPDAAWSVLDSNMSGGIGYHEWYLFKFTSNTYIPTGKYKIGQSVYSGSGFFSGFEVYNPYLVTPGPEVTGSNAPGGNIYDKDTSESAREELVAENSILTARPGASAWSANLRDQNITLIDNGSFLDPYNGDDEPWGLWSTEHWSGGETSDDAFDLLIKWRMDGTGTIPTGQYIRVEFRRFVIPPGATEEDIWVQRVYFYVNYTGGQDRIIQSPTPHNVAWWPEYDVTNPAPMYPYEALRTAPTRDKGEWYFTRIRSEGPIYGYGFPYIAGVGNDVYDTGWNNNYMKTWKASDPEPSSGSNAMTWTWQVGSNPSPPVPTSAINETLTDGWDLVLGSVWNKNVEPGGADETYVFGSNSLNMFILNEDYEFEGTWKYSVSLDQGGAPYCGPDLGTINGHLYDGAWWLGDNPWKEVSAPSGAIFAGVCNGRFTFESDTPNASFSYWVDPADNALPFDEPCDLVVKYRLTTASIVTDSGERYLWFTWAGVSILKVSFGDLVTSEGIAVVGDGSDSDARSLGTDVWVWVRFHVGQSNLKARMWLDGEAEPIDTWHVETPVGLSPDPDTYGLRMEGKLGNNGGTSQVLEIEELIVERTSSTTTRTGYVPLFRPLVDDPELILSQNVSLLEAGAMALDWQTGGEVQEWGGVLRQKSGRTEADMAVDGATIEDIRKAWLDWDQILRDQTGGTWADAKEKLFDSRAIIIIGDYSAIDAGLREGPVQPHGIIILPHVRSETESILVGDPLGTDFKFWPESEIIAYAESYGASELGVTSPQQIVYVNTRSYVAGATGSYIWPIDGNVTQEYGCTGYYFNPPRGGCAHFHDGIDIAAGYGTKVVAPQSGVVKSRGFVADGAFNVVILHEDGVSDLIGHLVEEYDVVSVGDRVTRGQTVGHVGTTGHTTGPHVHWELRDSAGDDFDPRSVTPGEP